MIVKYYDPWIDENPNTTPESFGIIDEVTNLRILKFNFAGYNEYTAKATPSGADVFIRIQTPDKPIPTDKLCYSVIWFNSKGESYSIWSDNLVYILNDYGKTIERLG